MARFIAIDWDQGQLHVAAATTRSGKVQVQKAALWYEGKSPNPAEAEELGKLLKDRLKEAGIGAAPVVFCIGRDRVILKDLKYPLVQPHEEPQMVRHQVLKELTDNPNDVVVDFVSSACGPKEIRAQAVILRKELLTTYQTIAKAAGLKLAGLTPRPFGSAVCVEHLLGTTPLMPNPEPADAPIALVTVADKWAEFTVVRKGAQQWQQLLTRALNVGPGLAGEIRRNLAVYAGQSPQHPIRAVYLALSEVRENGTAPAFDPMALKQRLTEMVDMPVHLFDPFAGAEGPEVPAGLRGSFVGAMGLLHGLAVAEKLPINFVTPRNPAPPRDPRNRSYMLAGCLLAAVFVALALFGWHNLRRANAEAAELERQGQELDVQVATLQKEGKIERALEGWETVVWLDELYDLTAMSPKIDRDFQIVMLDAKAVPPVAGTPHVGLITIDGTAQNSASLKKLAEELQMDQGPTVGAFYRPKAPVVKDNKFKAEILIKKRPPSEFVRPLPPLKKEEKKEEKVDKKEEKPPVKKPADDEADLP